MKNFIIILFSLFFFSCENTSEERKLEKKRINKEVEGNRLNISLIKNSSLKNKLSFDLDDVNVNELTRVDSLTLSELPEAYQQVYGDDYLYFYNFIELNEFDIFTLINGNQFGDYLDIFIVSKDSIVIADTSIVLDGSENVWEGKSTGIFIENYFEFKIINQLDSVGYSETEYIRKVDTVVFTMTPSLRGFESEIKNTSSSSKKIILEN